MQDKAPGRYQIWGRNISLNLYEELRNFPFIFLVPKVIVRFVDRFNFNTFSLFIKCKHIFILIDIDRINMKI